MTVAELIAELQRFPAMAEARISFNPETGGDGSVAIVGVDREPPGAVVVLPEIYIADEQTWRDLESG